jgi:hypothetical protein
VTGQLYRSVGKFIYPRGASTPLHFMPLHDFHLEEALEVSLLIALRSQRIRGDAVLGDLELSRWMDVLVVEHIAILARNILDANRRDDRVPHLLEYHAGLGITFETLRWLLARDGEDARITYTAVGPVSGRRRFEILHQGDARVSYRPPKEASSEHADLTIINHLQAVRRGEDEPNLEVLLHEAALPMILALRVCEGDSAAHRTTVSGNGVMLPGFEQVKHLLRMMNAHWRYRYLPGHDAAYFLPESGPETGVVLAYASERPVEVPRFHQIEIA